MRKIVARHLVQFVHRATSDVCLGLLQFCSCPLAIATLLVCFLYPVQWLSCGQQIPIVFVSKGTERSTVLSVL